MQFETKRLKTRKWTKDDLDFIVDGLNDFEVAKNLTVPQPYTKKDAQEFLDKHKRNSKQNYAFAIIRKEDGKVIGGTTITKNKLGEFRGGIWLHKNFQNQGYGQEIFIGRAKFAFDYLKLEEIQNGFYDFNERSKNMQLKMGYKIVGQKKNYSPALKSEVVEIITTLKKSDFEKFYKTIDFDFKLTK